MSMFRASIAVAAFTIAISLSSPALASKDIGLCPAVLKALDPSGDEEFSGSNDAAMTAARQCASQDKGLGLLSEAYVLRRMNKNDTARTKIDESLSMGGDPVAAYRLRCALLGDEKRYDEARTACITAIASDRKRALGYFGLGQLEFSLGRWKEALEAYQAASNLSDREDPNLLYMIGQCYNKLDRWDDGFVSLRQAIALNPAFLGAQIELSWALVARGHGEEALAVTGAAIPHHPASSALHRWRGRALEQLSRFDEAFKEYDAAVNAAPKWADVYWERGTMHHKAGRRAEALADYEKAIAIAPSFADAYSSRGEMEHEDSLDGLAVVDFSKAIELNPKVSDFYSRRGIALSELGEPSAMADFEKALELDRTNLPAIHGRAYEFFKLGKFDQALTEYTHALKLQPQSEAALFWRARTYTELKDVSSAINDYTHLINIEPGYAWAYYNRGVLFVENENCNKALSDFAVFRRQLPGRGYPWTFSAVCVLKEIKYPSTWWDQVREDLFNYPENVDKHIGKLIYFNLKYNYDYAIQEVKYLKEHQDDPMASQIMKIYDDKNTITEDDIEKIVKSVK